MRLNDGSRSNLIKSRLRRSESLFRTTIHQDREVEDPSPRWTAIGGLESHLLRQAG